MPVKKIKIENTSYDVHDARIEGIDSSPVSGSTNIVTSGGVYSELLAVAYMGEDDGATTDPSFDAATDTVWNKEQTLSSAQQAQARDNLGLSAVAATGDYSDLLNAPAFYAGTIAPSSSLGKDGDIYLQISS